MSAHRAALTAEEAGMLRDFRKLDARGRQAFLNAMHSVMAGTPMREAGIKFYVTLGRTPARAEAAVDSLLAGTPFAAGTGSA